MTVSIFVTCHLPRFIPNIVEMLYDEDLPLVGVNFCSITMKY